MWNTDINPEIKTFRGYKRKTAPHVWRWRYLRLIEVFDANTVHDSSQRPGSLRLLEDTSDTPSKSWPCSKGSVTQWQSCKRLPPAAQRWDDVPAALRPSARLSRWPGLEELLQTWLNLNISPDWARRRYSQGKRLFFFPSCVPKFSWWICSFAFE